MRFKKGPHEKSPNDNLKMRVDLYPFYLVPSNSLFSCFRVATILADRERDGARKKAIYVHSHRPPATEHRRCDPGLAAPLDLLQSLLQPI
jgi:hypothetical protein